jgi:ATP-dependent DNA ligase
MRSSSTVIAWALAKTASGSAYGAHDLRLFDGFTRIRDAFAALPVDNAVLDGEAVLMRPDNTINFSRLRSRPH